MQRKVILIPKIDIRNRKRPTRTTACLLVLIASLGLWIASLLASMLLPADMPEGTSGFCINLLYYIPFIGIPTAIALAKGGDTTDALRLGPVPLLPAITIAMLAMLSTFFASLLAALWGELLKALGVTLSSEGYVPSTQKELIVSVLTMAAMPAVFEEFLYRGVLFSAWESRGTKRAILVSALLFALAHGNIEGLPVYLFVGVFSAYLVFAMDSIYAGITFHTVYNATCLLLTYLTANESAVEAVENEVSTLSLAGDAFLLGLMGFSSLMVMRVLRKVRGIHAIPREKAPLPRSELMMLVLAILVSLPMLAYVFFAGGTV